MTFLNDGNIYGDNGLTGSGAIGDTGPLVKLGRGKTTLAGTLPNTYSGQTRVLDGELRLGKTAGVDAVPGDVLVDSTDINYEYGYLATISSEQIPDSATIRVGQTSTLAIGATETLGPLEIEAGAKIQTAILYAGVIPSIGTGILAGDIIILPFPVPTTRSSTETLPSPACAPSPPCARTARRRRCRSSATRRRGRA